MNKTNNIKKVVFMALICALAYIFTFAFHIKVSFLTFDFKNTILAIGALIFGPVSAIATSLVVSLLEMFTISDTGIWGCLMNFLASVSFAFTAGFIYKYKKTLGGAIFALISASVVMTAIMIPLNLVITPIYTGAPVEAVKEMILPLLLPFNAIKAVLCSAVTLLIYKPIKKAFKIAGYSTSSNEENFKFNKKSIIIAIISIIVVVICVFIYFKFFNDTTFELYTKK